VREQDIDPAARAIVAEKIRKYREVVAACASKKQAGSLTAEDLEASRLILEVNPEYYTYYNYRRLILERLVQEEGADRTQILAKELEFSTRQLKRDYKSYCTWHHRKWILQQNTADVRKELFLKEKAQCDALLKMDERNFHAWGYRRWVNTQEGVTPTDAEELKFTEGKIGKSFSNYSGWHTRVPLMQRHPELLPKEVDLALQAFYCDPHDQSTFLYMDWLLGPGGAGPAENAKVMASCEELLKMEGDIKWPLWTLWRRTSDKALLPRLIAIDPRHAGYYTDMLR
jgi:geranylgeranyl transferase type-2 subunit alpha